jgi:hypothetical protein
MVSTLQMVPVNRGEFRHLAIGNNAYLNREYISGREHRLFSTLRITNIDFMVSWPEIISKFPGSNKLLPCWHCAPRLRTVATFDYMQRKMYVWMVYTCTLSPLAGASSTAGGKGTLKKPTPQMWHKARS